MRKALIGLILTATVMTPVAAEAQRGGRNRGGDAPRTYNPDEGSGDRGNRGGGEGRAARNEARQQQQAQPQPQPQPQAQVVQRNNNGDGNRNWRGGDNNRNRGGNPGANNSGGGNNGGAGWRGRQGNTQPSIYPQAWQGNPNDPRLRHYQDLERRNQQRGVNDNRRGDNDGRRWRGDRDGRNDWRGGDRDGRRGDWNRGWRNDNRYDWARWRNSNRNIFRIGRYYSPYSDYGYNRFSIGFFLEPLFYDQRYWIGDPWQYRLPPAPYGTQWVRYFDDVILVDVDTGEVLDTIYDFFW